MRGSSSETIISKKKILVVEDNFLNRQLLCQILMNDYDLLEAENGQEALDILKQYGENISLVLLDIIMPVMDGYTFLSIMKADTSYTSIPVIVTTQSEGESDEVAALSQGAADFVSKPYRPQIILHRVASIINLRETAAMINLIQYDRLTGLYSEEFFYQRVKESLIRNPHKKYDIIYADIENFKLINDIFGITAGDRLLCIIAKLYTEQVGGKGICGRFNADRFFCLLERQREYDNTFFMDACTLINSKFTEKNIIMKWGIYAVENIAIPVEQMCDRAVLAAQSIKGRYGKYFATYDDRLREQLVREQEITDNMETALAAEQFEIYFQPKYRIKDHALSGAEALVRWNHPKWGFQLPGQFIPVFERSGFITTLDQYVWDKVCSILQDWDQKGYPSFPVSVNVSRADIYNVDLTNILIRTVQKYSLSPSRLHLEITESAYTKDPKQLLDTVERLRASGFIIEMDDFGSGYSSLNMLNNMPIDILKLDMNFTQSQIEKPVNQGILHFIMELARWMNLSVVAEGVETKEQLERLSEVNCDYAQGYFFAKPMPCKDFEDLIQKQQMLLQQKDTEIFEKHRQAPILLVADRDAQYRRQVKKAFENQYQVIEAADGEAALSCISRKQEPPAVVILSMNLTLNSLLILKKIQKKDTVVIATAPADVQLEEQALESGADDYAVKPHSFKSLRKRVLRITAIRERERILQEEAYEDSMTGLLNRRGLEHALASLRNEDRPLAVCLFDLDHLKQINDAYGHLEGDRLLIQFSKLLRSSVREEDILARFGGDEFIVIMKHVESKEKAKERGEKICRAMRKEIFINGQSASSSAGIAIWNRTEPISQVIARVDKALYAAKTSRRGRCCEWEE